MNNKKAFTLIELLVVVLIIGILSAIALPQYNFAVEKARFAEAQTNVASLQKAIDVWLLENGYPSGETTFFLGDNANGSGQLVVDLESGLDCSDGTACAGKNFVYNASCSKTSCYINVSRVVNSSSIYDMTWVSRGTGWYGTDCNYYPSIAPVGEKICKMLKAQDDNVDLCKDC